MSFWKIALIVVFILLLIPTSRGEGGGAYSHVQTTLADIAGFCDRNPEVCESVTSIFDGVIDKLKETTMSIEQMLHEAGIGAERDPYTGGLTGFSEHGEENGYEYQRVPDTTSSTSDDTLSENDRTPSWQGPAEARREATAR